MLFLDETSSEKNVALISSESTPAHSKKTTSKKTKAFRQVSQTLHKLILKFFPTFKCGESDTSCLLDLLKAHVSEFDFGTDIAQLEARLHQLRRIIVATQPVTSTQRKFFTQFTDIFKFYWVPRGETRKVGLHVTPIRKILRADLALSLIHIQQRKERDESKARNVIRVFLDDIQFQIRKAYDTVMTSPNPGNQSLAKLVIALEATYGMRRGAILDPNIMFYTWEQYKALQASRGQTVNVFRIGHQYDSDDTFEFDNAQFDRHVGFSNIVVQVGVLKDVLTASNKYFAPHEHLHAALVGAKVLVKPSICLSADEIVSGIKLFRKAKNITKENFTTRQKAANAFGAQYIKPAISEMFPDAAAQSENNGWSFGSHFARKVYANASYLMYRESVGDVLQKYININTWINDVLGHDGRNASVAELYQTVQVERAKDHEKMFTLDVKEQIELIRSDNLVLGSRFREIERILRGLTSADKVGDSPVTYLPKNATIEEKDRFVKSAYKFYEDANIKPTNERLRSRGIGGRLLQEYKVRHGLSSKPTKAARPDDAHEDQVKPAGAHEAHEPRPTIVLPEGTRIIAPKGRNAATRAKLSADDQKRVGANKVIPYELVAKECDGVIKKDVKIGKRLFRDTCVEDKNKAQKTS